jgi:cell division protein FtsL
MLILAIPKIYLSTQIYYTSKIVNDLHQDVTVLESQKEMLVDNIEQLRYKRDIADMIKSDQE